MLKTSPELNKRCKLLRKRGATLGEIVRATGLSKTTVYGYIVQIPLSSATKKRIGQNSAQRIVAFNIRERKGKNAPGHTMTIPSQWSVGLISLVAHFLFDGEITKGGCRYSNRSIALIDMVKRLTREFFAIEPLRTVQNPYTGVFRISYNYVELGSFIRIKATELCQMILHGTKEHKRVFLQAFFDDEGNVTISRDDKKRLVRGFQHDMRILRIVKDLLGDFGITSRIDEKYNEIIISKKENLVKFRDSINFSEDIFINPERTNSIWKRKLSKCQLLDMAIESYLPVGAPGVHRGSQS